MFLWEDGEKTLYRLNSDKIDEHEDELNSIDLLLGRNLVVTGAKDGLVKVWNIKKELVREIKFPEPISSVCFLNSEADILIGHVGKVSTVLANDYKPFETEECWNPPQLEVQKFKDDRELVNDKLFEKMKKQDDDIRN